MPCRCLYRTTQFLLWKVVGPETVEQKLNETKTE